MVNTIWVTATSLVGVVIGGTLSLFSQRIAERSASRRQAATIREGRREEQLTHLIAFIEVAMEAERLATSLHDHHAISEALTSAQTSCSISFWVRLRAVQLLCPSDVSDAAHTLAEHVHRIVIQGAGDQSVSAYLRPIRQDLIKAARRDFGRI